VNRSTLKNRQQAITAIKSALADRLIDFRQPADNRVYLRVEAATIPDTARLLSADLDARLQTASALDGPHKIEILYHWALDWLGLVITVRTAIDRDKPEMVSITEICPSAEWIEREMWELMGVSFTGHPDLRHLLLQDDWPEGKFPLRRDYRRD
jgi:Ni,Fe-hydrogenase III component G